MAAGPTLVGLFVTFLGILAVLQVVFPRREGFDTHLTRVAGARCDINLDCNSNNCKYGTGKTGGVCQ